MAIQAANPYAGMDFSKFMDFGKFPFADFGKFAEQFKLPGVDNKALVETQRKNVEAFQAANQVFIEGAQAVTQRQSEILRQAMDESVKALQTIAAAGTPEAKFGQQAELAKQAYESSIANLREIAELTTKSNAEAAEVLSKRVSESFDELKAAFAPVAPKATNGKAPAAKK